MLLLGFFLILILSSFIFPSSKKITFATLVFISVIFAFGQYKGDYAVYRWVYQEFLRGSLITSYEPGYVAFLWIATRLKVPFVFFRLICASLICSSLYGVVNRQTKYTAVAVALYSLFPFFIYTAVFRSGLASAFVILGLEKLAGNKKNGFIMFIMMATLFHYSSMVFLLLLLFEKRTKNDLIISVFVAAIILSVLINSSVLYIVVSRFTTSAKVLQWFTPNSASASIKGILAEVLLLLLLYYLAEKCLKARGIHYNDWANNRNNPYGLEILTYKLALLMFLLLPLMIYASPYMRIPYMALVFFVIVSLNDLGLPVIREDIINCRETVPFGWIILLVVVIAWKTYFDLPYLKQGTSIFWEYLEVSF